MTQVATRSPWTGEVVCRVDATPAAEVAAACRNAGEAAAWLAATSQLDRAALLDAAADTLEAHRDQIVALADAETGLGEPRLQGELDRTANQARLFATVLRETDYVPDVIVDVDDARQLRRMMIPLGPVAVFAASNFPLAFSVLGGDTVSALAAGCPVVVKSHEAHAGLAQLVSRLLDEVLPAGLVQVVHGRDAGLVLVADEGVRAVAFTGSMGGALALKAAMAERREPAPFFGELGSVNPVVICPRAASTGTQEIAEGCAASALQAMGQFCTQPGLVFVPARHKVGPAIRDALGGASHHPLLHAGIVRGHREAMDRDANDPRLTRHTIVPGIEAECAAGPVVQTVAAGDLAEVHVAERFGPSLLLVEYDSEADLHGALARLPGSLTGTIHAAPGDEGLAREVMGPLAARVGRLIWNGWPTGVAVSWAMVHGGPWPATTAPQATAVGVPALRRFQRPICFQDVPEDFLSDELRSPDPSDGPPRG